MLRAPPSTLADALRKGEAAEKESAEEAARRLQENGPARPAKHLLSEADIRQLGASRPIHMTLGWRLYQLKPGIARAWLSPLSKRNPQQGPSLKHYSRHDVLGTVLVVEHTARFSSANVLLQRPRAGAHDLSVWDDPV